MQYWLNALYTFCDIPNGCSFNNIPDDKLFDSLIEQLVRLSLLKRFVHNLWLV